MFEERRNFLFVKILCLLSFVMCMNCTDPVAPEYDFVEDLIYVDAYVSTITGGSYAIINETTNLSRRFVDTFVKDATVSFRNLNTDQEVFLTESADRYVPSSNFKASVGETWELLIKLSDGRTYQSKPETILEPIDFSNLQATYDKDLLFNESEDDFFPGHVVSLDLDDPATDDNYYFWKFRSFERLYTCDTCFEAILRGGECVDSSVSSLRGSTLTYGCETNCWQIRYNEDIQIFSDDFANGNTVRNIPVGNVVLYSKNSIVVEIEQYSLSASGYKYYKVLKDLVDNNVGLNAPPPAALVGNMFNPNNSDEFVLGRFTAAAAVVKSIFIDRTQIREASVERPTTLRPEKCADICRGSDCSPFIPPPPECIPITRIPCEESRFRTSIRPEGWVN